MKVIKQEAHLAIHKMAKALGLQIIPFEISPFPVQIHQVFSAAYEQDYHPEDKIVLLEAYKLLQTTGCYFTEEN